jgi:phospholipid transport system substrate-binding protein
MRTAILALILLTARAWTDEAPASPASAVVTRLQDGLITLMKTSESGDARTQSVTALLRDTHDLPYISRVVLGRHWRKLSAEEQASFVEHFEALSVASYTSRFRRYNGERFDLDPEESIADDQRSVRSVLTTGGGEKHEFVYVLHRDGERWSIVNIVVDGVSDLALKRAEYGRLMDSGGFAALIAEISDQTERMRARAAEST